MRELVYHIDVNSAFLSWTACARKKEGIEPDLREIASVIGGSEKSRHGIVLAKSMLAKSYGIQTGEPLFQARKKCPGLVVAAPDFRLYVKMSSALIAMLKEYAPEIRQYSIDEAWMEMTSVPEAQQDPEGFAVQIKERIRRELGFTVNVGVSCNHLLAKMASELKKPDRVHTLFPEEIPGKMWPLQVEELFFVGKTTARKLHALGIHTIGELAHMEPDLLEAHLKKHGRAIWGYANGQELDQTMFREAKNKGYGNEMTLPDDVVDEESARAVLLSLCETVGARLRQDGMSVSVVGVNLKDADFVSRSRQTSLVAPTSSTNVLYEEVKKLFGQLWDGRPLRLIGVFTSKAEKQEYEQLDLFQTVKSEKQKKLDEAIDQIRHKYGDDSIKRARFLDSSVEHMSDGLNQEKRRYSVRESKT